MPPTSVTLLAHLRDLRDSQSWSEFVEIYSPVITGTIRRLGIHNEDVDDILQDVLLQMTKIFTDNFEKDETRGRFRSLLRKITENKVRDFWRKRKIHIAYLDDPGLVADEEGFNEAWQDELNRNLFNIAVQHTRKRSQPNTWKCFQEHVLRKRRAEIVAFELGMSENAVFVNSSRVMARIRAIAMRLKGENCCAAK